jgi:hypothetical protein
MSFTVEWTIPAETVLLRHLDWRDASDVAQSVQRYARERAPKLPAGPRRFVAAGYAIGVRIDVKRQTVIVGYVFRLD